MFLWVTDFYSLEKIISAFPKIVLLYLKMAGDRNGRVGIGGGGVVQRESPGRRRTFVLEVSKSSVSLSVLALQTGQGVAWGGGRIKGGDGNQGEGG